MSDKDMSLKRCPFCGGEAKYFKIKSKAMRGWRFVACLKCGCRTATYPPVDFEIGNLAKEKWNKRVNDFSVKHFGIWDKGGSD